MTYIEKIYDAQTEEITEREYTPNEIAEIKANEAKRLQFIEQQKTDAEAKAALLNRLGITAEEAKLLLS